MSFCLSSFLLMRNGLQFFTFLNNSKDLKTIKYGIYVKLIIWNDTWIYTGHVALCCIECLFSVLYIACVYVDLLFRHSQETSPLGGISDQC